MDYRKRKVFVGLILVVVSLAITIYAKTSVILANTEKSSSIINLMSTSEPDGVPLNGVFKIPQKSNSSVEEKEVAVTNKAKNQIGAIFSTTNNKLDLTQPFSSVMYLKLDGEAEGMTFILHNDNEQAIASKGIAGGGLGAYGSMTRTVMNSYTLVNRIKESFAVEFDLAINSGYDYGVSTSVEHIATSFPGYYAYGEDSFLFGTYRTQLSSGKELYYQLHQNLQYPKDYGISLGDNQWRKFAVSWVPFKWIFCGIKIIKNGEENEEFKKILVQS